MTLFTSIQCRGLCLCCSGLANSLDAMRFTVQRLVDTRTACSTWFEKRETPRSFCH